MPKNEHLISVPISEVGLPKLVSWVCHRYKMDTEAGIEYTSNYKNP